jgi:hypothetical protein
VAFDVLRLCHDHSDDACAEDVRAMVEMLHARVASEEAAAACAAQTLPDNTDALDAVELLATRLRTVASAMWSRAVQMHDSHEIDGAIIRFEHVARICEGLFEHESDCIARCFATLAHLYLRKTRIDDAMNAANRSLTIQQSTPASEDGCDALSLAHIVLIKCMVHRNDPNGVQTQVEALLASHTTATELLAAIADEISVLGDKYQDAATEILQSFVSRIAALPVNESFTQTERRHRS